MIDLSDITDPTQLKMYEMLLKVRDRRVNFAKNHHRSTRGTKMNFVDFPHLKDVYNTLSTDIALMGSVQCGKSEWLIIDHFACASLGLSVFMVLAKVEARNAYVQNRIDRCIDNVPEYKRLLQAGTFSNTAIKNLGKGVIKYIGSNVEGDFREFPGDVLVIDEEDDCNAENLHYAKDRLRASIYQFTRSVGNPTISSKGIAKRYNDSTQNKWNVVCDCGERVNLDWFNCVVSTILDSDGVPCDYELRDETWKEGKDVRTICPHCGNPFSRWNEGLWVPGKPTHRVEGFHLHMMQSRMNSLNEMWDEFREALGDPGKMQKFYNSNLGLPFMDFDSRLTNVHLIRAARQGDGYQMHSRGEYWCVDGDSDGGPCSMGVDVGKFFDVRVSRVEDNGNRRMLFAGKVKDRSDLINIGERYGVEVCVIDSQPEARIAQEFQDEAPFYVWLCRYSGEGKDGRIRRDKKARIISPDRTTILDKTLAELKAGRNIMPANVESVMGGEFAQEMTVSVRQTETDRSGNTRYVWSKGKDHQRHADVYDYLASTMMATFKDYLSGITIG